ncbi:acetylneuraminic acid synthetase [Rhodobacterales bacterium FZCC0069]|nr:acetylneuraminic acid synthetase [Rhodobacterales bacterium FZCC0069]
MMNEIRLGKRNISPVSKPYIIAEIGVNHEGSMKQAKRLIELAKEGGADAAKFQSYKADTLASKNSPSYWDTSKEETLSQHELFRKYDNFDADQYVELARHCNYVGIDFVSTPFDDEAIEFLNPLVPFFKIASADLTNTPFLRKVAQKGKPIVLSTGAATLAEIDAAVRTITNEGCQDLALLHCILNYPTDDANAHLRMIKGLGRAFPQCTIGYSDHTLPDEEMSSLITSYLLGAVILEKHFTHDKKIPGNDHYHAMDFSDLSRFVERLKKVNQLLGLDDYKRPIETEQISRTNARRSIVLQKDLPAGHRLSESDITYKRPGSGISPLHWDDIIGKKIHKSLKADHILQWMDLSD